MPKSSIQRQEFGGKKPYLIASVFALALVVFVIFIAEQRIGVVLRERLDKVKAGLAPLTQQSQLLQSASGERDTLKKQADQLKELADTRFSWIDVLTAMRSVFLQAENTEKARLVTPDNGGTNTDVGIWLEEFSPVLATGSPFSASAEATSTGGGGYGGYGGYGGAGYGGMGGYRRSRYGNYGGMRAQPSQTLAAPVQNTTGEITDISLLCRGVNRNNVSPNANTDLAFLLKQGLTNNPAFKQADLSGDITVDPANSNNFTFSLTVKLTHPIKL
jgi:hypothetical protein